MVRRFLPIVAALFAACASAPPAAPPPPQLLPAPDVLPATGLRIAVVPVDALVEVDGVTLGMASSLGEGSGGVVPLAPGVHRVIIRKPGYETWRVEVSVRSGIERLNVTLVEQP